MANSLLAHLYSRIRGSQEDIATESLRYILMQSEILNHEFTNFMANTINESFESNLEYSCQEIGQNSERPDMSGKDSTGKEVLLCEMKFYAGLTENQPLGYIERLKSNSGKGLIFVCPERRKKSLWDQLVKACIDEECQEISEFCIDVNGVKLSVVSWQSILILLTAAVPSGDSNSISDIKQLDGYCAQMDSEAFIPFTSQDLSAEIAINAERYYRVVDETAELLCMDSKLQASNKGTKASPNRNGYERKILVGDYTLRIAYDRAMWKEDASIETPFWVTIQNFDDENFVNEKYKAIPIRKKCKSVYNFTYLALEAPVDMTLDEVCNSLKQQIIEYLNLFLKK